jgi:hypothetical protein
LRGGRRRVEERRGRDGEEMEGMEEVACGLSLDLKSNLARLIHLFTSRASIRSVIAYITNTGWKMDIGQQQHQTDGRTEGEGEERDR